MLVQLLHCFHSFHIFVYGTFIDLVPIYCIIIFFPWFRVLLLQGNYWYMRLNSCLPYIYISLIIVDQSCFVKLSKLITSYGMFTNVYITHYSMVQETFILNLCFFVSYLIRDRVTRSNVLMCFRNNALFPSLRRCEPNISSLELADPILY